MKFKLLAGFHVQADKTKAKISFLPNIPEEQRIYPDIRFKPGDVFDCEIDLCALHNQPGIPPKFERVDLYQTDVATAPKDGLEDLTVKQLVELSEAYEVDLKGNTKKDLIVAILRGYGITPETVGA
jgi:hypothetical protein